jgi:hypothetical protein
MVAATLSEEDIVEVSFPLPRVVAALRADYAKVRVIDPDRSRPSAKSERLFFHCNSSLIVSHSITQHPVGRKPEKARIQLSDSERVVGNPDTEDNH